MAVVLARGIERRDAGAIAWAVAVWPGTRRGTVCCSVGKSPRAAFVGVLAFLVPLGGLQRSARPDKHSRWILLPYTTYVIAYDDLAYLIDTVRSSRSIASINGLTGSSRGAGKVRFRGGGVAPASACRTVRRCTSYFSDNALIDRPQRSASRRIVSNNSTRDSTPPPPRLEKHRM
jgi:hypothetical protein